MMMSMLLVSVETHIHESFILWLYKGAFSRTMLDNLPKDDDDNGKGIIFLHGILHITNIQ